MPGYDGTGPSGQGPFTGQGRGFCVLTTSEENPDQVKGVVGLQSVPISQKVKNFENTGKEVINMSFGDRTGPAGLGPMTGRAAGFCAGYPVPGYMNPVMGGAGFYASGVLANRPYSAGLYGYGLPYGGRVTPRFRRGFGRGKGRFGNWW
jgi:hypothetical protein